MIQFYKDMQFRSSTLKLVATLAIITIHLPVLAQLGPPKILAWNINGERREALIYVPTQSSPKKAPIIFAFHGYGGTMQNMYRTRNFQELWPEAIFVCPQGLNTIGQLGNLREQKPGWSANLQTDQNRDLQFFDAILATLTTNYDFDDQRIYATGHSNGGSFVYLLLAVRPSIFAAFAPTATAASRLIPLFKTPKPVFHLIGEKDPVVKPLMQRMTYNGVLKLNDCAKVGVRLDSNNLVFQGKSSNDVQLFTHAGGHDYPKRANVAIINFFKKYKQ